MPKTYRAFLLDARDKIVRAEILDALTDDTALAAAAAFTSENDVEVWQGERRIARLNKGAATPPPQQGGTSAPSPA